MKTSKGSKRSRRSTKGKSVKRVTALVESSHTNTSHIHTYGRWVSELAPLIPESKRVVHPSLKRPSL